MYIKLAKPAALVSEFLMVAVPLIKRMPPAIEVKTDE
jgi:hypothetical protein